MSLAWMGGSVQRRFAYIVENAQLGKEGQVNGIGILDENDERLGPSETTIFAAGAVLQVSSAYPKRRPPMIVLPRRLCRQECGVRRPVRRHRLRCEVYPNDLRAVANRFSRLDL